MSQRHPLCIHILVSIVILSSSSLWAKNKSSCTPNELKIKSCRLSVGQHTLTLLNDNIRISDGVRHWVNEFPLKDPTQWESIRWKIMGERRFLEVKAWSKPQGEGGLQNLHWYVLEILKGQSDIKLNQVIQKRKPHLQKSGENYIKDPLIKHSLGQKKNGEIHWSAGRFKGYF